ncbi:hypothetical protein HMPREF3036_01726, partial [Sutterella sp. KLE1602]
MSAFGASLRAARNYLAVFRVDLFTCTLRTKANLVFANRVIAHAPNLEVGYPGFLIYNLKTVESTLSQIRRRRARG